MGTTNSHLLQWAQRHDEPREQFPRAKSRQRSVLPAPKEDDEAVKEDADAEPALAA